MAMTPPDDTDLAFLRQAADLALRNVTGQGGRPFGAVLVEAGRVLATGVNEVTATGDPTAHAEMQAIRAASAATGRTRFDGCAMYASGHPCPMCLSAMYLCGVSRVYCACSLESGEPYGLSTAAVYAELAKGPRDGALAVQCVEVPGLGTSLYDAWRDRQASRG